MEKVDTVAFPVVLSANPWAQGVRDLVKRGLDTRKMMVHYHHFSGGGYPLQHL